MDDSRKALEFALETYPERVEVVPVEPLILESARQNEKRPAYVKIAVPDEIVKSLRGGPNQRDLILLIRVPREILDRAESRIILPGEIR